MDKILEIKNLSIGFKDKKEETPVVKNISFSLFEGEVLAIVGESGCGKSVTAKSLMGLLPDENATIYSESQVIYKGENILQYNEKQWTNYCGKECAMIFQDSMAAMNPTMTVGKQIAENLRIHQKMTKREALKRAALALKEVGINDSDKRVKQYPHEFSGGMRQRSMIAMAIVCNPRILIADEPTTALDVTIQIQILQLMKELKEKNKMSILLITHDLGVVAGMADRIAVMYAGKIVEMGEYEDIYYHSKHPYTRSLLDAVPRLDISEKEKMKSIKGMPPGPEEKIEGCVFAPRCPYCMRICLEEEPILQLHENEHSYACWLDAAYKCTGEYPF